MTVSSYSAMFIIAKSFSWQVFRSRHGEEPCTGVCIDGLGATTTTIQHDHKFMITGTNVRVVIESQVICMHIL